MIIKPPAKIVLGFIAGLLCFSETYSQTFNSRGTTELGGTVLFSSQTTESDNEPYNYNNNDEVVNTFAFNLYLGKMLTEGFELGIVPSYISVSEGNYSASLLGLYLAPAAIFKMKGTAHPFVQAMFGYDNLKQETNSSATVEGYGLGLSTGVKIVLGASGLMLIEFQYMGHHFEDRDSFSTLSFGIGFRVFVPKKNEVKK